MKGLRILVGITLLALAAPLVGGVGTASAAPASYYISAYHQPPSASPPHAAYMDLSGLLGGAVTGFSATVSRDYTVGSQGYEDYINAQWWQGGGSATVRITPLISRSPLSIVSVSASLTDYFRGNTATITGSAIFDNLHQKMVSGSFTVTVTGKILIYKVSQYGSSLWSSRMGTMTEVIHLPASGGVSLS